jgi:hypothetical protein
MDNNNLWQELDNVADTVRARFDASSSSVLDSPAIFIKPYKSFLVGTKALVVDRQGEYYALAVRGKYVEGIHKSFLRIGK